MRSLILTPRHSQDAYRFQNHGAFVARTLPEEVSRQLAADPLTSFVLYNIKRKL